MSFGKPKQSEAAREAARQGRISQQQSLGNDRIKNRQMRALLKINATQPYLLGGPAGGLRTLGVGVPGTPAGRS